MHVLHQITWINPLFLNLLVLYHIKTRIVKLFRLSKTLILVKPRVNYDLTSMIQTPGLILQIYPEPKVLLNLGFIFCDSI